MNYVSWEWNLTTQYFVIVHTLSYLYVSQGDCCFITKFDPRRLLVGAIIIPVPIGNVPDLLDLDEWRAPDDCRRRQRGRGRSSCEVGRIGLRRGQPGTKLPRWRALIVVQLLLGRKNKWNGKADWSVEKSTFGQELTSSFMKGSIEQWLA